MLGNLSVRGPNTTFGELAGTSLSNLCALASLEISEAVVDKGFFESLGPHPQLRSLSFKNCNLPPDTVALIRPLPRLTRLKIAEFTTVVSGLNELACKNQLISLDLSGSAASHATFEEISQLPKLERLNLSGTCVDNEDLARFKNNKVLNSLDLSNTSVSADTLRTLSEIPQLKQIEFRRCRLVPPEPRATPVDQAPEDALLGCEHLDFTGTPLSESDFEWIAAGIGYVEILYLGETMITDKIAARLLEIDGLASIYVEKEGLTEDARRLIEKAGIKINQRPE